MRNLNPTEDGRVFKDNGKEYPQRKDAGGYHRISYYEPETKKTRCLMVHRVVAMKYLPNPENKEEVNHIDGNKSNNSVSNLEWVTRSQNHQHAYRLGLKKFTPRDASLNPRGPKGRFS